MKSGTSKTTLGAGALTALGALCLGALSATLYRYPLLPLRTDDLEWSVAWLAMTCIDYYGAALCLCAVIFSTEDLNRAIIWSALCLLLGAPFCCLWLAWQLASKGTIALAGPPQDSLYE
ncbi:hypothetical protein KFE25_002226 [Diacronema lutheri]|uniref:Uncharacterized protein n=1 Tax=Diacronema lutheri TaxID=2081491 RepID=A0A8J5XRA6_DIALT|nr:hypothetical protein KFE25_002226 [Diacronema lutheri]